jgi:hypothetical protein
MLFIPVYMEDATDDYIAKIRDVVDQNQTISYDRETARLVGMDRLNEDAEKIYTSFWEKGEE